ncbi:hypothetical protein ACFIOY_05775 [Bradyrhizobium sp. TZ2]
MSTFGLHKKKVCCGVIRIEPRRYPRGAFSSLFWGENYDGWGMLGQESKY